MPRWIAPNLITFLGFSGIFLSWAIHMYHLEISEDGSLPDWVYIFGGASLLIYQILDNVDGKQARATGTSSPLGQLFDHGCDAMCFGFIIMTCTVTIQASYDDIFLIMLASQFVFFLAHWQEHHIHVLNTVGVAEFQLIGIATSWLTYYYGNEFWTQTSYFDLSRVDLVMKFCTYGAPLPGIVSIITVFLKTEDRARAVKDLLPLASLHVLTTLLYLDESTDSLYHRHPLILLTISSLLFTHLTNQMIICATTHENFSLRQPILFPLIYIVAHNYLGWPHSELMLGVYLGIIAGIMYDWITRCIEEICCLLGIWCLTIPAPGSKPSSSSTNALKTPVKTESTEEKRTQ